MKYQVTNSTPKTSATGTNFVQVTLTDEQGVAYDKINLFNGESNGKEEIEGDLVQNGQYWKFKAKVVHTAGIPARGAGIAQAQARKQEGIEHSQDRKEDGIARAGSISNATNLIVAMINAGIISSNSSENQVQEAVIKYAKWYKVMYSNPSNADETPF